MTRALTSLWSIDLDDSFERRAGNGDLVFWRPGRTVYASVYDTDNAEAEEAIGKMLEGRPGTPARTFDRAEPGVVGHAYLLPEGEGDGAYWGLNSWTAAKGSVACVTFYFDGLDDLRWALDAWQSVHCGACERNYLN